MEYEAQNRFEELDTEDEERLRYGGYEPGSAPRGAPRDARYQEAYAYEDEYDIEEDHAIDDGGQWQIAMRQKEEELVDRALRRISRARLRGESDVNLTREEIDALERRQLIPQTTNSKQGRSAPPSAKPPAKPKRRSAGGMLGFGGGGAVAAPKQKTRERKSLPLEDSPRRASPDYTPPLPPPMSQAPTAYISPPASRPNSSPSKPPSRSGARMASGPPAGRILEQQPPPSFRPPSSSSRNSPTRSLPDDPNWIPRSRSSSSAPLYPAGADPFAYQVGGPSQFAPGRRNISGPSTVSYSSLRRAPPPPGAVARVPSGSGLTQEVVDLDSDEVDDDDEDEEESDDSDEGVTLDLVPESNASSYRRPGPPALPPARSRRGGRR